MNDTKRVPCRTCQDYGWVWPNQGVTRPSGDCYSTGPDVCPACKNKDSKKPPEHLLSRVNQMRFCHATTINMDQEGNASMEDSWSGPPWKLRSYRFKPQKKQ